MKKFLFLRIFSLLFFTRFFEATPMERLPYPAISRKYKKIPFQFTEEGKIQPLPCVFEQDIKRFEP